MSERHFSIFITTLMLLAMVVAAGPVLAARGEAGGTKTVPAQCDDSTGAGCPGESNSGPNGGPKKCGWLSGMSGAAHLACLGEQICEEAGSGGSGFGLNVDYFEQNDLPSLNFTLGEGTGCTTPTSPDPADEVFSYCFRETGDVIGYTLVAVEQPNLVAKIHKFVENPGRTGEIEIAIDDHLPIVVEVGPALQSADRLNKMVCTALGASFRVACLDDFFVVYGDRQGQTPQTLSLSTAGSGVSTTEIALEPIGGNPDITACSERSEPGPLILPPR